MTTAPSPDLEDRLRRTLVAEADRHPVRPDLAAVRSTVEDGVGPGAVVDLRAAPRRTRARLLAAAVLVAVVALAGVAVVASRDTGREPVAVVPPAAAPTGWYLPGPDWTIEQVHIGGRTATPGQVRRAMWVPSDPTRSSAYPQMEVTVARTTDPRAAVALVADREFDVWAEEDGMRVRERAAGSSPSVDALATVEDLVLRVRSYGLTRAEVVAYATAWRASGGADLPTPDRMARLGDSTAAAEPVAPEAAMAADLIGPGLDGSAVVGVEVRGPGGEEAMYDLSPPDRARATATLPTEGARAAGLTEAELYVERPGRLADATVWEPPSGVRGAPAFVAEAPGASISLQGEGAADLLASLRPATAEEWGDAVRDLPSEQIALALAPTLADVHVTEDDFTATATTTVDATEPAEGGDEPMPPDGPDATTTTEGLTATTVPVDGPAEVGLLLSRAGLPTELADEVIVGFIDDPSADVVLTGDDRLDPARWQLPLDGRWGRDGTTSALDLATGTETTTAVRPGPTDPQCLDRGGDRGPTADDAVLIEPTEVGSCIFWFAVVVRLDGDGRVAEARLRLWEP